MLAREDSVSFVALCFDPLMRSRPSPERVPDDKDSPFRSVVSSQLVFFVVAATALIHSVQVCCRLSSSHTT